MPIRQHQLPESISQSQAKAFERTLSLDRWRTYQIAAGFHDDLAHRLYLWNAAVGQSFHFPLQSVEVALRNVTHQALTAEYGADWPSNQSCQAALGAYLNGEIQKTRQRHLRRYRQNAKTPQIVASLTLGFWVTVLRKGEFKGSLWRNQIRSAFPLLGHRDDIADVAKTATTIQDLRNRIFHQEPLIGRNLSADYSAILKMLGWICPETRSWTRQYSSVPRVLRERPR